MSSSSGQQVGLFNKIWKSRWAYLFVMPALLSVTVFNFLPMIQCIFFSFQKHKIGSSTWIAWANFSYVLSDSLFWKSMWNTCYYTLLVVPLSIAMGLFLSVMIYAQKPKVQGFFKGAYYLPGVVSPVIIGLIWAWLFYPDQQGLLNYALSCFKIAPVQWLGQSDTALPSVIFMVIMTSQGAAIILFTAAMGSIPTSLYESARLEGATVWQEFWNITLPLIRPVLLYLLVMTTISSFNVFDYVWTMTQGGPANATTTIVYLIYETAFQQVEFGEACAQAMVLFAVVVVISIVQFKFLSTDVEY